MKKILILFFLLYPVVSFAAFVPDFSVHKFGQGRPVILVVGGIQGDEPGGFSAASLLATRYNITQGSLWIVPNLNFPSIIERSRGLHGDMNRKFASLKPTDPEYKTVSRIKELICSDSVDFIINLHDGSGFYRPTHESAERNPSKWGQSIIIDMEKMPNVNLAQVAEGVVNQVNKALLQEPHKFYIKNTKTDEGDPEMERCLTWFAVKNNKPAYAVEVSKKFSVEGRVYYHLQAVEAFFKLAGLRFKRDFPLRFAAVREVLQSDISIAFRNSYLPLEGVKPRLSGHIPVPKNIYDNMNTSSPIIAITGNNKELKVHYGNRLLTKFTPQWYEHREDLESFWVVADGKKKQVKAGEILTVRKDFLVESNKNIRINAIGVSKGRDESNMVLTKKDFAPSYSVDTTNNLYRVEAYSDNDFLGSFLVHFGEEKIVAKREYMPDMPGPESDKGF